MNERQRFAFTHPCQHADEAALPEFRTLTPSRRGLLLSAMLTVNR